VTISSRFSTPCGPRQGRLRRRAEPSSSRIARTSSPIGSSAAAIACASADALAASHVSVVDLDRLAAAIPPPALDAAIRSIASGRAARTLAEQIAAATGRIHDLVGAVKRFTFMDRESVPLEIDVAQGLADTLVMLENKSRTNSVAVRFEVAPDLPRIFGFGSEINQVWAKLVDNAMDAAGLGGHVTVAATARGDSVVVQVIDDGPGIPEEHRTRVFDPFFTTKPVGQGTGLGLDLARRVVDFHHGTLDFTSEPGGRSFACSCRRAAYGCPEQRSCYGVIQPPVVTTSCRRTRQRCC
jgi:signal transduction histidine kinase